MPKKINLNIVKSLLVSEKIPYQLKNIIAELNNNREAVVEKYKKMGYKSPNAIICSYVDMDEEAKAEYEKEILAYNFPIAIIVCKKYAKYITFDSWPDMYSIAFSTIIKALRKYDCNTKKAAFHTYLTATIKGEVIKFIDSCYDIKFNYHYEKKKFLKNASTEEERIENGNSEEDFFEYVQKYKLIPFSKIIQETENGEINFIETINYENTNKQSEDITSSISKEIAILAFQESKKFFENYPKNLLEKEVIQALFFDSNVTNREAIKILKTKYPNITYYEINRIETRFMKDFFEYLKKEKRDLFERIVVFMGIEKKDK